MHLSQNALLMVITPAHMVEVLQSVVLSLVATMRWYIWLVEARQWKDKWSCALKELGQGCATLHGVILMLVWSASS